jgi:hypothetical protein
MMEAGPRPAPWTFGGVAVVVLLALAWAGSAGVGFLSLRGVSGDGGARAVVHVVVTDGTDARLWLERPGEAPREMPLVCEAAPGKVALRVARHTDEGAWRQDTVELHLQPGRLHLVPVGGRAVQVRGESRELARDLVATYPAPGVVGRTFLGLEIGSPEPEPLDTDLSVELFGSESDYLPAVERLLIVANPYLEEIRVGVAARHDEAALDWKQECTVPSSGCRVFGLGGAATVTITTARTDGALIDEDTYAPPPGPGRPLFTIGGGTVYRWFGRAEAAVVAAPAGEWTLLPADLRIRTRRNSDPPGWLLVVRKGEGEIEVGLAAVANPPLVCKGQPNPMEARADVVVRELALPDALEERGVGSVAASGDELLGVVDGVVHDLRTGRPLHERTPTPVVRVTATPHGLVLVTRSGRMATLRDGRVVLGMELYDAAVRLAPAAGDPPAVWVYGSAFVSALIRQPLDGSEGQRQSRTEGGAELPMVVTSMAPAQKGTMLFATGRRIESMRPHPDAPDAWSIEAVLTLPEGRPDVIGLLDLEGRLVFATDQCVYELRGDLVVPLVEGIGGELVPWRGGILVCDARTGRLHHLSGPALAQAGGPR